MSTAAGVACRKRKAPPARRGSGQPEGGDESLRLKWNLFASSDIAAYSGGSSVQNGSCKASLGSADGDSRPLPKLAELLQEDSWRRHLAAELEAPYLARLDTFLRSEAARQVAICPPPEDVFRAYQLCPLERARVVIIGQDPYHSPGQAQGLAFSVPQGVRVPSSLQNVYAEIRSDLGCPTPPHGNLQKWCSQGVMLLNTSLTVAAGAPASHSKQGWENFTDATIRVLSEQRRGLVFLLWGAHAHKKEALIDKSKHHVLKAAHPSGLSAHRGFFGCKHFSKANALLQKEGLEPIDWQID
eukprot:jgi/Mesen1/2327/ME000155S01418